MRARQLFERAARIPRAAIGAECIAGAQHVRVQLHELRRAIGISNNQVNRALAPRNWRLYTRLALADLARLEQQRAQLAGGFGPFHAAHLRARVLRLRASCGAGAKMIEHALAQVVGLAHI